MRVLESLDPLPKNGYVLLAGAGVGYSVNSAVAAYAPKFLTDIIAGAASSAAPGILKGVTVLVVKTAAPIVAVPIGQVVAVGVTIVATGVTFVALNQLVSRPKKEIPMYTIREEVQDGAFGEPIEYAIVDEIVKM